MNNKDSAKIWRVIYVALVILNLIVITYSISAIVNIPKQYGEKLRTQTDLFVKMIKLGIEGDTNAFASLKEKYPVDFLIFDNENDKIIYATIDEEYLIDLRGKLNKNAIAAEKFFNYKYKDHNYDIWFIQYYVSPQEVVNTWLEEIIKVVFLMVSVNIVTMSVLFFKFLRPLKRLKDNVMKISKYQLDLISTEGKNEYDAISNQLVYFAKDLKKNINESEISYTILERNLQIKNEKLDYRNRMVASLTHDLKAPLTNIYIDLENEKRNYNDVFNLKRISSYQETIDILISDINDIAKIVYQESDFDFLRKEKFDLIELLLEVYRIFRPQFSSKNLNVELEIDETLEIYSTKLLIKQVIHNALSNIFAYTAENSNVIISCYKRNEEVYLSFYNDAKKLDQTQLDNIFSLFYRISDDKVGAGTGLYTIKTTVNSLGGIVGIKNILNGIILEVSLKAGDDDESEN